MVCKEWHAQVTSVVQYSGWNRIFVSDCDDFVKQLGFYQSTLDAAAIVRGMNQFRVLKNGSMHHAAVVALNSALFLDTQRDSLSGDAVKAALESGGVWATLVSMALFPRVLRLHYHCFEILTRLASTRHSDFGGWSTRETEASIDIVKNNMHGFRNDLTMQITVFTFLTKLSYSRSTYQELPQQSFEHHVLKMGVLRMIMPIMRVYCHSLDKLGLALLCLYARSESANWYTLTDNGTCAIVTILDIIVYHNNHHTTNHNTQTIQQAVDLLLALAENHECVYDMVKYAGISKCVTTVRDQCRY